MSELNTNDTSASNLMGCGVDRPSMQNLAPLRDWSRMGESEHFVQFYDDEEFLLDSVSGFIAAGLAAGDACIVVATRPHLEGLEERLREQWVDVAARSDSRQYVALDALKTLSMFMTGGSPDPDRFARALGNIIASAARGRRRVRIFGEMVALLCSDGNYAGATRLEQMWNRLRDTHSFSLFCAYPMSSFAGESLAGQLGALCAEHSTVIPAESYAALTSPDDRLRAIALLQQQAKSLQAEIAERKEAEAREQRAQAEAECAGRMKDEFLATVSHELRTPLGAIIGWAHMLRKARLDEATVARAAETIERNARSQAQLIEDLLDASRMATGRLRLNIEQVDLVQVICSAADSVQLAADSKDIRIEMSLNPSARHTSGDPGRLRQVVWNLLLNAIKFTPAGGRVEVRLERVDSDVQIKVSDTGQGISPDFLPFIFDRFRQADGTSTRRHGGLGLGLAIVRHLVELHGGIIQASSDGEGLGATFTVRLPLPAVHTPGDV